MCEAGECCAHKTAEHTDTKRTKHKKESEQSRAGGGRGDQVLVWPPDVDSQSGPSSEVLGVVSEASLSDAMSMPRKIHAAWPEGRGRQAWIMFTSRV